MDREKLKIAYVTRGKADDPGNWSGIVRHIKDGLIDAGHEVHVIDGIPAVVPLHSKLRGRFVRMVSGKTYAYDRDIGVSKHFAREVEKRLAALNVDCVVSPVLPTPAYFRTHLPIAIWDDGPFHCLREIYPQYDYVAADSLRQGDYLDRLSVQKCSVLGFASRWAADDAIQYHHADPEKVLVLPFGSNCPSPYRDEDEVMRVFEGKPQRPLKLLFVGIDWQRKGGSQTLEIHQDLRRRRVDAQLTIVGCNPFSGPLPEGVICLGRLDKGVPEQAARLQQCFRDAHIFIMPTRAECFGVVYAEAAAHALPSIGTRVGGVADAVVEGETGWLFDLNASPAQYGDLLASLAANPSKLREASIRAFRHQQRELNWGRSIDKLVSALRSKIPSLTRR
jgi:glycosyltransferase involved in cell wall biosynthesis